MKKTKFLVSGIGLDVLKESGKYPLLSIALESIATPSCAYSVRCGSTRNAAASLVDWWLTLILSVPKLCSHGGWDSAIGARCCMAWGKAQDCPSSPPGTSRPRCMTRCTRLASVQLYSTVAKRGDRTPLTSSDSVAPTNKTNAFRFTTAETWRWGYYVNPSKSEARAWICVGCSFWDHIGCIPYALRVHKKGVAHIHVCLSGTWRFFLRLHPVCNHGAMEPPMLLSLCFLP